MTDQAGGLVDDQQIAVFVNDLEEGRSVHEDGASTKLPYRAFWRHRRVKEKFNPEAVKSNRNRLMRTHRSGGGGAGRVILPPTRFDILMLSIVAPQQPSKRKILIQVGPVNAKG